MNINILKRISFMLVLCLMQALVLNHIHIFGCATPLLYVYLVLLFPRDMAKWAVLVWAFVMG
ncbi:MAG: rod shape-determining protein MreD, partial [Prevotella sp.]|nr:rod shape-determining protein MreD [Prevotella sp.]